MPKCRCADLEELEGPEAVEYAQEHLRRFSADPDGQVVMYRCAATGTHFVLEYTQGAMHGRLPHLRRVI